MTKQPSVAWGALVGAILTAPLMAIMYLAALVGGFPFFPFDLFKIVSNALPGPIITFGIDSMVAVIRGLKLGRTDLQAKNAERTLAILMVVFLGAITGLIYFAIARAMHKDAKTVRQESQRSGVIYGIAVGALIGFVTVSVNTSANTDPIFTFFWILLTFTVWGSLLGWSYGRLAVAAQVEALSATSVEVLNRRQFLIQLGAGAATITVIGAGLSLFSASNTSSEVETAAAVIDDKGTIALPNAKDPVQPAPGTRPEYTRQKDHYRIDINVDAGPKVDEATYKLAIGGLVENATEMTLSDVKKLTPMNQFITQSCISNPIAGDLISTTLWTGTSMQNLLNVVKPKPEATHIKVTSADGFDEFVPLATIRNDEKCMLAWNWDNQPLTDIHGFPLRIHVPDHYGMKQPKWITGMEFVSEWEAGYWVRRGWDNEARVNTTSVIDTVSTSGIFEKDGKKFVPIGGIAWAGIRGISKVQVQIDNGEWIDAQLRSPLSEKTWVIWRLDWEFTTGAHTFHVRCVEKDGTAQVEDRAGVRPSGATGLHSVDERL